MPTSSERYWQSYSVVSVFTRMCMGNNSQFSRITNRWKWFTWRIWLLPPASTEDATTLALSRWACGGWRHCIERQSDRNASKSTCWDPGEVTRIPPGHREDTFTCSLRGVLEWDQSGHWGCVKVCNVTTNAAFPTTSAPDATRDPFRCLADSGNRPVCHQPWDISVRVGLLFQVSVRLRNTEPSDECSRHCENEVSLPSKEYHNVWSATMEAIWAPMHSRGSLTSGASITLHQIHITLSQTASLNGTFKPWNTFWRK